MIVKENALTPRNTDKLFDDSPDAGRPDCLCSRCGARIKEGEIPIRVLTTNEKDEVDENSKEYRYCNFCLSGKIYFYCRFDEEYATKCETQCDDCKFLTYEKLTP